MLLDWFGALVVLKFDPGISRVLCCSSWEVRIGMTNNVIENRVAGFENCALANIFQGVATAPGKEMQMATHSFYGCPVSKKVSCNFRES